jgi:hypothetical protein
MLPPGEIKPATTPPIPVSNQRYPEASRNSLILLLPPPRMKKFGKMRKNFSLFRERQHC